MNIENTNIETRFDNSLLTEYLERVIGNRPMKDVISNLSIRLQIFTGDGETQQLDAIDRSKVDYIVLATKLSTMIEMFNMLKEDNNLVMTSELEREIERFEDQISKTIEQTNKELINE